MPSLMTVLRMWIFCLMVIGDAMSFLLCYFFLFPLLCVFTISI